MPLLEPIGLLQRLELEENYSERLAVMEELKTYPFEAVWDYYCEKMGVPTGMDWLQEVRAYEREVLACR